ncbi:MAG: GntR family transcriptional regulator [Pseudomonadota bacterium]
MKSTTEAKPSKTPRESRATEIQQALEREIVSGELKPGVRLNEYDLAQKFNASRTPVREAIQRLESKGIVNTELGKGAFVARPDPTRLIQLFEALSEVEGLCARLAARRITTKELDALERNHEEYKQAAVKGEADEYFKKGMEFHHLIAQYSRNAVLQEIMQDLSNRVGHYRRRTLELPQRLEKSIREHGLVIEALRNQDPDAVEQLMLSHTGVVADTAMDVIHLLQQTEDDS